MKQGELSKKRTKTMLDQLLKSNWYRVQPCQHGVGYFVSERAGSTFRVMGYQYGDLSPVIHSKDLHHKFDAHVRIVNFSSDNILNGFSVKHKAYKEEQKIDVEYHNLQNEETKLNFEQS